METRTVKPPKALSNISRQLVPVFIDIFTLSLDNWDLGNPCEFRACPATTVHDASFFFFLSLNTFWHFPLITIYHHCLTPQATLNVSKWYVNTNSSVSNNIPSFYQPLRSTTQHAGGKSDVQKDQKMDRDLQVPHHAASLQNFQSRVRLRCCCLLQT